MTKNISFYVFFFFISFLPSSLTAEDDSLKTTVIIFEDATITKTVTTTKNGAKTVKRSFPKNNVKLGIFGPAYGEVPIYYERYIADWFTIQAGVGVTVRDFLGEIYNGIGWGKRNNQQESNNWNGVNEFDDYDDFRSFEYRKSGVGVCVSIAPRFFIGGDAFDGWYLSPSFGYAIRTGKIQNVDAMGFRTKSAYTKEKTNTIYVLLNWGWQTDFEPVVLDFSFSVGMAKNSNIRQDIGYTNNGGASVYGNKIIKYGSINPYFKLNLDLGGIFGPKKNKK